MARLSFRLATDEDDGALRAILKQTPMPGSITLSFEREPSFFAAERAGNLESQTILYVDGENNKILGFGGRSIRRAFVDGTKTNIGYLSMLRGLPEARRGVGLARGYRYLRSLHADGKVPFYFTTILDENVYAKSVLESGRAGLPTYHPLAQLVSYLIPLRQRIRTKKAEGNISKGVLTESVECLNAWNRSHKLAPAYELADLLMKNDMLPGFNQDNFYTYWSSGRAVGTLGVWDQTACKQSVVAAYSPSIRATKLFYNMYAGIRGMPGLPNVGQPIKSVFAAFVSSEGNNPEILAALLSQARADWSGKGYDYLILGLSKDHPLAKAVELHAMQTISSTVYIVYWPEDGKPLIPASQTVHLEIATL